MMGKRVQIIAEEASLTEAISYFLTQHGFAVARCSPHDIPSFETDILLLDWPSVADEGIALCRQLRLSHRQTPLLLLSTRRNEEDVVQSLEAGADDYLVKPFGLRELEARLNALLRRARARQLEKSNRIVASSTLNLVLDSLQRTAQRNGQSLELSRKEFDLLWHFAQQPGRVHSRNALLGSIWEQVGKVSVRTVDVHIRWLREKIELDPSQPTHLVTVRGVGYRFDP